MDATHLPVVLDRDIKGTWDNLLKVPKLTILKISILMQESSLLVLKPGRFNSEDLRVVYDGVRWWLNLNPESTTSQANGTGKVT